MSVLGMKQMDLWGRGEKKKAFAVLFWVFPCGPQRLTASTVLQTSPPCPGSHPITKNIAVWRAEWERAGGLTPAKKLATAPLPQETAEAERKLLQVSVPGAPTFMRIPQDLGKQGTDGLASVYKLLSKHICIELGQKSSFSIFYKMLWEKKLKQIFGQPRKCLINNSTNVLQIKCDPKPAWSSTGVVCLCFPLITSNPSYGIRLGITENCI